MIKYLSLFSGIGAFEQALTNINVEFELVNYCEIDKYASKSYAAIHNIPESKNLGDITQVDINSLPLDLDLITHGSPCQDFSVAGNNAGGDINSNTRSSLMWNTVEIVKHCKPKYVIWENVKNVLSKKHKHNFERYLKALHDADYKSYYKVLNAKNYGVPQNRERIFVVSIRNDLQQSFMFPNGWELDRRIKDILEPVVDNKYYISQEKTDQFTKTHDVKIIIHDDIAKINQVGLLDINGSEQVKRVYGTGGISSTLNTMQGGNRQPKIIEHKMIQEVKVRKYKVDIEKLKNVLKTNKQKLGLTINDISNALNVSKTTVEHWFRNDDCFSIPDAEIWRDLKNLLQLETDESMDKSIMEFETKPNCYDMSNRIYDANGIAPTLTCTGESGATKILQNVELPCIGASRGRNPLNPTSRKTGDPTEQRLEINYNGTSNTITTVQKDNLVINTDFKIRKLTPLECWRLMGFPDAAFYKAQAVPTSNTQLYKQAGNSIVVPVLESIFKKLLK